MGSYRRDRHTASRNSAGSTTERAPLAALRRLEALPDPAPRCGENSRPGKVHHRLERQPQSHPLVSRYTAVKRFSLICLSSVANKPNRVAKFLALDHGALLRAHQGSMKKSIWARW
jgi:hypothetical protein